MEEMICKIEQADEQEQFTAPKGERRAKAEHFVRRMASALKEIFHHLFSKTKSFYTPTMHGVLDEVARDFCDKHMDLWYGREDIIEAAQVLARLLLAPIQGQEFKNSEMIKRWMAYILVQLRRRSARKRQEDALKRQLTAHSGTRWRYVLTVLRQLRAYEAAKSEWLVPGMKDLPALLGEFSDLGTIAAVAPAEKDAGGDGSDEDFGPDPDAPTDTPAAAADAPSEDVDIEAPAPLRVADFTVESVLGDYKLNREAANPSEVDDSADSQQQGITDAEQAEIIDEMTAGLAEAVTGKVTLPPEEAPDDDEPGAEACLKEVAEPVPPAEGAKAYAVFEHPQHDIVAVYHRGRMQLALVRDRVPDKNLVGVNLLHRERETASAYRLGGDMTELHIPKDRVYGGMPAAKHKDPEFARKKATHYDVPSDLLVRADSLRAADPQPASRVAELDSPMELEAGELEASKRPEIGEPEADETAAGELVDAGGDAGGPTQAPAASLSAPAPVGAGAGRRRSAPVSAGAAPTSTRSRTPAQAASRPSAPARRRPSPAEVVPELLRPVANIEYRKAPVWGGSVGDSPAQLLAMINSLPAQRPRVSSVERREELERAAAASQYGGARGGSPKVRDRAAAAGPSPKGRPAKKKHAGGRPPKGTASPNDESAQRKKANSKKKR
jgi:hypothetical protein